MNSAALKQLLTQVLESQFVFVVPFVLFAWFLMLLLGNPMIAGLKSLKGMKWSPREDTPDSHLQKAGTPSMGGLGILAATTLAWVASLTVILVLMYLQTGTFDPGLQGLDWLGMHLFLGCVLAHGALGFADDWSKARGQGGLTSKAKLAGQIVLALVFLVAVREMLPYLSSGVGQVEGHLYFEVGTLLVCLLLIIGTSNAVNLTDGIDGLAAGLCVQVGIVFFLLILEEINTAQSRFFASNAEMVWLSLGSACLGFLAFNKNPARVFMGDTGSLALGAALGAGAVLTRSVFLLPFVGFIFYVEMFSVIAQVAYFKYTKKKTGEGKRIFRRAPLHHHFELGGWSEWRVVGTFWIVNALMTLLGIVLWKMGILPRFP